MLALSFLEIITIITAFQLLMLGVVLLTKRNRISNLVLSFYMFANALLLIWFVIRLIDLVTLPSFSLFYYLLGPLIYLYVKSVTEKEFKLSGKLLIHGFVFFGLVSYWITKKLILMHSISSTWDHWEYILTQIALHLQIAVYIVASFIKIKSYRKAIKEHFSSVVTINLSWLLLIIVAFALMWLTDFYAFMLSVTDHQSPGVISRLMVVSILINFIFANLVVYKGLQHAESFSGINVPQKYSGSKMREDEMENIAEKLIDVIQKSKPYLNPDLTIKDLSEQLQIHQKYLSQVINAQFGQNFYDFVNQYRVKEAKEIITNNTDSKKTILEILYEVGFNSKSAFNNAFKKNTGKTPSEFKRLTS